MPCRKKPAKPGDIHPVNNSDFHYALPPGLTAGTLVKLISFDHGYWTVESLEPHPPRFTLFLTRIDTGWQHQLNGRWL